ncbi:MAG: flagellar hook-associated protein FlgL [bacterium]|nr:flagellar hook-associated protein FlgL [bacterium]
MRVTNQMMSSRVVFNLQRSMQRYITLQTNMSTGRKINAPSDDPVGTVRDLNYRTELNELEQWQKNIGQAQNWTRNYDTILGDAKDFMSSAREIAVAMADGTYDAAARQASASEVDSIIDQIMQMANSELEGRRVFGGNITQRAPFQRSAAGLSYRGDSGRIEFEIESGQRSQVNFNGQETFLKQLTTLGENADLNVGISATTALANLHNGDGVDLTAGFTITDSNTGTTLAVDLTALPANATINDLLTSINTQLTAAGMTNITAQINSSKTGIAFDTTLNGLVSGSSNLGDLRQGLGIDLNPGTIRVTDGALIDFTVDLSGSVTLNDVITKFNTQVAASGISNVTMSINPAGTGLQIVDTNGTPLGLQILDTAAMEQTATGLGIDGNVGAQLIGEALDPNVRFAIAETTGSTAADLGILAEFTTDLHGEDIDARLIATTLLSELDSGLGYTTGSFKLTQGDAVLSISLSDPTIMTVQDLLDRINNSILDVTASINPSGRGIQIVNDDPTRSFAIEEVGTSRAAKNLGLYGSSDMMGILNMLASALKTDDQEGTGLLIGALDKSIEHLLTSRATAGARGIRLETTAARLTNQELDFTELLSDVEDIDLPTAVTQLATYENGYQAALMAASKIIQPSLMDFLK